MRPIFVRLEETLKCRDGYSPPAAPSDGTRLDASLTNEHAASETSDGRL